MPRSRSALAPLFAAALALACSGDADRRTGSDADAPGDIGGTMIISSGADADILFPPLVRSVVGNNLADMVYERLAELGDSLNTFGEGGFTPELAQRWEWGSDSLSLRFHLDPRARWHDGKPVTARDVAFTYRVYTSPEVGAEERSLLAQIDSVTAPDSLTAVFWYKQRYPQQFFDATHHMRILPEHVWRDVKPAEMRTAPAARQPVGSGRWRFARWDAGSLLELVADTAHRFGRPHLDRVMLSVTPDYDASFGKLLAGDADFLEFVRPARLPDVAADSNLRLQRYPSLDEGFMQFNLRDPRAKGRPHPILGEREVRRALTMAIDRNAILKNVFDTLAFVPVGPVTRAQSTWDASIAQIPFEPAAARRTLDSLGWRDANGDGIRERNGRELRIRIGAPTSSAIRIQLATLIQAMLKDVGVRADIEQLEMNQFLERTFGGDYDAAMMAVRHDPSPGGLRQSWSGAAAREPDGSNSSGYASATFDALVDSGLTSMDLAAGGRFFRRAYETIVQDAPAVWLYETKNFTAHHRRIRPVRMRADAWWANIAEWTIPAAERIPRDRVGLTARAP